MNTRWMLAAAVVLCGASFVLAEGPVLAPTSMPATTSRPAPQAADKPAPKANAAGVMDPTFSKKHDAYVALAKGGNIDLYFEGDSITDGWHGGGKAVWDKEFAGWKPGNFGIGGDRTQHVIWRLENGELDGVKPKVFVLMIGTNNLGGNSNEQIVAGNAVIVKKFQDTNPDAKILLLGIFPRGALATDPLRKRIKDINLELAKMDDGKNVKFLDIGDKFLAEDGSITKEMMKDALHPGATGYQIWADAIKPVLTGWLGAPKEVELKKDVDNAVKDQLKKNMKVNNLPAQLPPMQQAQ